MKKRHFVLICSFFFSLGGNILNFSLVYLLADRFSFHSGQIGIFLALGQVFYFFGCNLYHRLGSAFDPLKVFSGAAAVVFLFSVPIGHIRIIPVVYAAYWILQITTGLYWPPVMAWLTSGINQNEMNREISLFNRSWMAANILGPLIGGPLYHWNKSAAFIFLNACYFSAALLIFIMRRIYKNDETGEIYSAGISSRKINNPAASSGVCCSHKELHSGFNTFLTAPRGGVLNPSARIKTGDEFKKLDKKLDLFRYRGWMIAFFSSVFAGIWVNIIPLHIRNVMGFTESSAGLVLFLRCAAGFAGFTLFAKFTAWQFNRHWTYVLQGGLIFSSMLFIFAGNGLNTFFIIAVIYGLLNSASYTNSIFYSSATGGNPKKNLALHEIFLCLGNAAGTAGGGFIYQRFQFTGTCAALTLTLCLGIAAFVILDRTGR